MPRLYKGSELKYNTGVKVPDGTIKDIRLTFYTDDKASFVKTYSKDEIEVIDGCLSCSIDKKDTLLLNEGVLNCKMESSVVRDDFPDTYDTVFSFNTPYYLKDTLNPEEIKYQEKTITSNGTYTADDGYVALSKVDVDIPEKQLQQKTIIQNGEVLPDSGYDGFSKITVDFTINIANGIKFGGSNFTKIPFKLVCDGSVTNLIGIFQNCPSLKSVDVDNWNTENVISMLSIFQNCSALQSLNLSSFNTKKITSSLGMMRLFSGCTKLTKLILSSRFFNSSNTNYDFSDLTAWTDSESIAIFVDALPVITSSKSVNLSAKTYSALSVEQKSAITNKGWTVTT